MKLSQLGYLAIFATSLVSAQGVQLENYDDAPEEANGQDSLPSIQLNITYNIEDKEEPETLGAPISFDQDEVIMLNYTLTNDEDCEVSVLGVSGNILSYPSGELVTKISFGEMEDLYARPSDTLNFRQKVVIDLEPGMYYLFPVVHVSNETAKDIVEKDSTRNIKDGGDVDIEPKSVAVNPTVLNIEEPLMSIFDPRFLSIQLGLLAVIGGFSYYYLNKRGNNKATNVKKGKRDPKEWLPEQYKK